MIEERKKLFRETVERYSANDSRLLETKDNILGKYEEFVQKYGDVKKSIRHISRRHLRRIRIWSAVLNVVETDSEKEP